MGPQNAVVVKVQSEPVLVYLDDMALVAEYGGSQDSHLDSGSFLKSLERIRRNMLGMSVTPTWSLANIRARGVSWYENLF